MISSMSVGAEQAGGHDAEYGRRTVTMPEQLIDAVASRTGQRGFSAYVSKAVARQLEQDRLDELVREQERRHGPVSSKDLDEVDAAIRTALGR